MERVLAITAPSKRQHSFEGGKRDQAFDLFKWSKRTKLGSDMCPHVREVVVVVLTKEEF